MDRIIVPLVLLMMTIAGIHGLDQYHAAAGITGLAVGTVCSDTDSNNPYAAGTTSYAHLQSDDRCVNNDLLEFYCTSEGLSVRAITCPNGCSAGACN